MKATGIVRRIDDLGRVVIPKEIRRTLRIREGEPLEIFTEREGEIVLKKYSQIRELSDLAKLYVKCLAAVTKKTVCVCDCDRVVAAAGEGYRLLEGCKVSRRFVDVLRERTPLLATVGEKQYVELVDGDSAYVQELICPILCEGDVIGAVVILLRERETACGEAEQKLVACAAEFLGRQMEQ